MGPFWHDYLVTGANPTRSSRSNVSRVAQWRGPSLYARPSGWEDAESVKAKCRHWSGSGPFYAAGGGIRSVAARGRPIQSRGATRKIRAASLVVCSRLGERSLASPNLAPTVGGLCTDGPGLGQRRNNAFSAARRLCAEDPARIPPGLQSRL